jgi:hypothetical protein
MQHKIQMALWTLMVIVLAIPVLTQAAVVGRFTQVTGAVDVLKDGKIPGLPAKVQDGVEPGDVVRTKTNAKSQLTMVDDSIITMAPESRLALADYRYDAVRQERRAVVRIFRGLVQTVVKRIIKTEEPDFIIETHTAVVGVRGSNPYTLLMPAFTGVYLPQGLLQVNSNNPAIPFQVLVRDMEFTEIPMGKQPLPPQALTPAMLNNLDKMMTTGIMPGLSGTGTPTGGAGGGGVQLPVRLPASPDQKILQQTIPPVLTPKPQVAPPPPPAPAPPASPSPPPGGPSITPGPGGKG